MEGRAATGRMKTIFKCLLLLIAGLPALSRLAAQQPVQSRVNPQVVAKGQQAAYEIILPGRPGNSIGGTLPNVPGLEIGRNVSSSSSMQVINGNVSQTATLSFPAVPRRTGTFTIPGWVMEVSGRKYSVPPATFKAVDAGDAYKDVFRLSLALPSQAVYVGQRVTGTLRLLVRQGVSVRIMGPPEKTKGEGFTLEPLEQNSWTISQTLVNGIRFDQGTVQLRLTPVKSGPQTLQFSQNLAVRGRNTSPLDGFFGRGGEKVVPLETDPVEFEVRALPASGKPVSFTGAVGKFDAQVEAGPSEVRVGEPVTLTYRITGEGSFDRIQAPVLDGGDDFKVYPPKVDSPPGSQQKSFEYLVIPQREGTGGLLEVPFSYFEPEQGIYVDLTRRPMDITVLPVPEGSAVQLPTQVAKSPSAGTRKSVVSAGGRLLDIRLEAGRWRAVGDFTVFTPGFVGTQATLFALFAGLFLVRRRQLQLAGDAGLRRRIDGGKAASKWLQQAEDAAAKGDAPGFLDAALRALQEEVGRHRMDSASEAITYDDVRTYLEGTNADESVLGNAQQLFDAGDLVKFGGAHASELDLSALLACLNKLREALK